MRNLRLSHAAVLFLLALAFVAVSRPAWSGIWQDPSPIEIPITIDLGNAIVPVVGSYDGYAALPPELVLVSVPFAKGVLAGDAPLTVYDAGDRALPTQASVLAKWNDGSVRWALLRFNSHLDIPKWSETFHGHPEFVSVKDEAGKMVRHEINTNLPWDFTVRRGAPPPPAVPVTVTQEQDLITVSNGRISVRIAPRSEGFGFAQVSVNGIDGAVSGPLRLLIRYPDGTALTTSGLTADEARVEENGPLRAVIFVRGRLKDLYEWQTRLIIHADEPAIRADHTIGGLGDREVDSIDSISLEYSTRIGNSFNFRAAGSSIEFPGRVEPGQRVSLQQEAPGLFPPRDFAYQLSILRDGPPQVIARGGRSDGWLRCSDEKLAIGIALRDFSEKGPKEIRVGADGLCSIDLWPKGQNLKFSRARAISHQVLYSFHPVPRKPAFDKHWQEYQHAVNQDLPYRSYVRPVVPRVDTEYTCRTQAFGPYISAAASRLDEYERVMQQNFENSYARHLDRGVHYGMMHYGDYVAPWPGDNGGNPDRPHWRDEEWEFTSALFLHYLRRGDTRAFRAAVAAYRHFMDVDVHYSRGVNFYHSYGDRGEMHETYYGPDNGHTVCAGLVDAYLFTGDRRALQVAMRLGDNLAATFNQGDEALNKIFQRELRAGAWPLLGLTRLYEITLETRYLEAARHIVQFMKRNRESWLRGGTWQSALLSAALENYHRVTGDSDAGELFLAGVNWLLDSYYTPELKTLGPRPGGPAFGYGDRYNSGGPLMVQAAALGYAYELTRDRYYLEVGYQLLTEGMKRPDELITRDRFEFARRGYQTGATRSDGKWFSLINFYTHRLPTAFEGLSPSEWELIRKAHPNRR